MSIKKTVLGAAVCSLGLAPMAQAVDFSQISINGFGSVVGGMTLDDDETYFGNDDELAFQNESRFALQVSAPIGEKWSATAQILARGADDFDPKFEWAYVGYQVNDDLKILMGRQRFKLYKYSDYLDVGYAYPWIRPPQGTYSLPFSSGDGISAVYTTYTGDLEMTFTGAAQGINIADYTPTGNSALNEAELNIELSYFVSGDFVFNEFNFGFNVAYVPEFSFDGRTASADLATLLAGLEGAGVPESVIDDIEVVEDEALTYGVYFGYDPGPFFFLAEYAEFDYDPGIFSDAQSWYVTFGLRHQKWTFHATYGEDENEPSSDAQDDIPAPIAGAAPALVAGTQAVLGTQIEDSTTSSFGVRYDIETGIALKGDFTLYQNSEGSAPDAKTVSVGVDFVF